MTREPDRRANVIVRGAVAGLAAGALCGVMGRIVMRLLAVAAGAPTGFTLGGTLTILVVGLVGGCIAGLAFVGVRDYLPGSDPARGATYGALLFVLTIPLLPPSLRAEAVGLGGMLPLALVLFCAAFVSSGVLLAVLDARLRSRDAAEPRAPAVA